MSAPEEQVRTTFEQYDKDGNGKIDLIEFRELVHELGSDRSPADVEADFNAIDKDAGGLLEFEEFARWWNLRSAFDNHDEGRTGTIGLRGFQALVQALGGSRGPAALAADFNALATGERVAFDDFARWWSVRSHFDKFDRDGDAMINLGEFHLLVNELGHTGTPTEIAETFEQLDADGRGALGFDAFLRWWSTH